MPAKWKASETLKKAMAEKAADVKAASERRAKKTCDDCSDEKPKKK